MTNVARLPGPVADVWDWQRLGLCRGRDSAQFFHPDGERGASRGRREAAAKSLCRTCPVRAECAAHALNTREPYGVWGGFTETERLRLMATGWEDLADRRQFLIAAPLGVLGAAVACGGEQKSGTAATSPAPVPAMTPGAPPTFGTAPGAGHPLTSAQLSSLLPLPRTGTKCWSPGR